MINFNKPYDRTDFIHFLEHNFLPDDFQVRESSVTFSDFSVRYATAATCLGVCPSLDLEVYEISHSSSHDSRVGTAQDAFQLLLHRSYKNRALVVFVPEGSKQYRFSLLQIEALQNDQSARITRSYSNPRRYSFLLGEGAHIKTPEQFLIAKGRLILKDGSYFNDLQERFSVETLTKQFYKELSDWYFWAVKNVSFPNDINDDNDNIKYNAENVIRLITRLIFVWFLRQKELVKPDFFDTEKLSTLLKDFDAQSAIQHNYYRAILQNLFFATLNQETGKRRFAEDKGFLENRSTNTIKNYYRYEKEFCVSTDEVISYFSQIPFLNGGLFECLDAKIKDDRIFYWDGFSRNPKRQAHIANELFFAETKTVDLSSEYNDTRMRAVKVSGIIEILKRYNFTVEENTPIDVVVALDPELLGKVFENLLGAYNPETQETARKQTGSFYTPREIVSYMVNESLIAYLKTNVPDIEEEMLRQLLSYENNSVEISETQSENLIQALFNCKILDPACGSGAFPMGILQQMVHVLGKLDSDNTYWNKVVMDDALAAFDNAGELSDDDKTQIQEEIERTFDDNINHPNYARKLYLIENCIYGVDIQSIAVQISKLRFFISLICEQTHGDDAANNFGIRPLPNLETKFVAANTLIGIEKNEEDMLLFKQDKILKLITRLEQLRHRQFLVTNAGQKKSLREADEVLRREIVTEVQKMYIKKADDDIFRLKIELKQTEKELEVLNNKPDVIRNSVELTLFGAGKESKINVSENKRKELNSLIKRLNNQIKEGSNYSRLEAVVQLAQQLTSWDPYDQNASSPFFDPEWMFGVKEGFDVVIGNPPYVDFREIDEKTNKSTKHFKLNINSSRPNLYLYFIEKSLLLLKQNGILTFINPAFFLSIDSGFGLRKLIINEKTIKFIVDVSYLPVFEASTYTIVYCVINNSNNFDNDIFINRCFLTDDIGKFDFSIRQKDIIESSKYNIPLNENHILISKIEKNKEILKHKAKLFWGTSQTGYGRKKISKDSFLKLEEQEKENYAPIYQTSDIKRYFIKWQEEYIPRNVYSERVRIEFQKKKILIARVTKKIQSTYDESGACIGKSTVITDYQLPYQLLIGLFNSKLINFWYFTKYETTHMAGGYLRFDIPYLELIPLPDFNYSKNRFIKIVNQILEAKQENPQTDTSEWENEIDLLVYRLYDLTYDEVKVVDPEFGLTEEEYNRIEIE